MLKLETNPALVHSQGMTRILSWVGFCGIFLLAGCAQLGGPAYERPGTAAKNGWSSLPVGAVSANETINPEWWRGFNNRQLNKLISSAIQQNTDLKILASRMNVTEAAVGQVRATGLPSLQAGAGMSIERSSGQSTTRQYSAATAMNWEVDIWGKVKKGVQAQQAEVRASAADWRAGYLSLVSDVSSAYFQILQLDEQSAQQKKTLNDARRIQKIYQDMLREGIVSQTQVLRQKAEVNQLKRGLLEIQRQRDITENAIATLLGTPAGKLKIPSGNLTRQVSLMKVPTGLPSDLLSRRPDIVAAEYRVLKAHNSVGEAKLARLPSFSLTGRLGSSSLKLSDLLKSFTAGLLPTLNIPILDPSISARLEVSKAQAKLARDEYQRVVIKAFEEVENALINLDSRKKQHRELKAQLGDLRVVSRQIKDQLKEGMVSQLEVFESERSLLSAELALLENKQLILSDTVKLYKALGGGWTKDVVSQASLNMK